MRILFILDEFLPENSGGAANVAFSLAKGLIGFGHELMVLTATYDINLVGETEIENVKIKRILARSFGRFRNFKNLKNRQILKATRNVLLEYKPDITHIHTLHHRFSYDVIGLAKKFSKAIFITLHDAQTIYNGKLYPKRKICDLKPEYDYKIGRFDRLLKDKWSYNPLQKFFIKKALKKVDKIFAVSNVLKLAIEANDIYNIEVIHNGIDAQEWMAEESRENKILFAGRVDDAKGVSVLIKAFDIINSEISDAKLTIVGDGNFNAGGNQNVKVLPWQGREAMKKIFAKARIVVVPSLYLDPFPTINLEAMAASRPVVGTCFGGTPEVVVDNETGYIVNPYNEEELIRKVIELLQDPEKAAAFGGAGRERVEKLFSIEDQVEKTLFWYNKFISQS